MRVGSQAGQDIGTGVACNRVTHIREERGRCQYSRAGSASIMGDTGRGAMAPRRGCRPRTAGAERWEWHPAEIAWCRGCWCPYGTNHPWRLLERCRCRETSGSSGLCEQGRAESQQKVSSLSTQLSYTCSGKVWRKYTCSFQSYGESHEKVHEIQKIREV